MRGYIWLGVILIALGLLGYVVLRLTIVLAVVLFVAGLVAIAWGAVAVKRRI